VSQVWANEGTIDVVFEDGETDEQLRPNCVRPFQPYRVGEVIEARDGAGEYLQGTVVKIHPYARNGIGLYDVQMDHGAVRTMVSTSTMRRFYPEHDVAFEVGTAIEARYAGRREWFTGTVTKVNPDGSYSVQYDDGDFENSVPSKFLRVLNDE
jgi:Agenet domain